MESKICHLPYEGLLTYGKEYKIIRETTNSYVVKRNDGTTDRMSKIRFMSKEEFVEHDKRIKILREQIRVKLKL